jgi:hypothetical protein
VLSAQSFCHETFFFQERFGERIGGHHHSHVTARHAAADFDDGGGRRHEPAAAVAATVATRTLQRNLSSDSFHHLDREVSAMFHQNTIIARL